MEKVTRVLTTSYTEFMDGSSDIYSAYLPVYLWKDTGKNKHYPGDSRTPPVNINKRRKLIGVTGNGYRDDDIIIPSYIIHKWLKGKL